MWTNKAAAVAFGKNIFELNGQYCHNICCNIFTPCENCPATMCFITGKEESAQVTNHNGRFWDIRAFPIKDDLGRIKNVIEIASDVTERISLQAEAAKNKHLASLGELAAGVAHEINNPINNIINYAQILHDEFEEEKRNNTIPDRIIRDGDRIAMIVRSLLSFARIKKEEKSFVIERYKLYISPLAFSPFITMLFSILLIPLENKLEAILNSQSLSTKPL